LVDENLGSTKLPGMLRRYGYKLITHRTKYKRQQGILDPQIIADCGRDNLVLLTGDGQLETLWATEIEQAKMAVVILANNTDGAKAWGKRLGSGRVDIMRRLAEHRKPCALRFGVHGRVTHVRLYGKRRASFITL
jgi:hypothetical protein